MNRGSKLDFNAQRPYKYGFNEAPIHESGKCDVSPHSYRPCAHGFNEAPIHESGK